MSMSIRRQADAVELQRQALAFRVARRPPKWSEHDNQLAAIRLEELSAAVKTLRWVEANAAAIKQALEPRDVS